MRNAIVIVIGLVAAACGSKKDDKPAPAPATPPPAPAGSGSAATTTTPAPTPAPVAKPAAPLSAEAAAAAATGRKTRIYGCTFSKLDGEGKDRKVIFTLKNLADKKADAAQAWIYYYDTANKLVGTYPHRFFTNLEPGATEEHDLGHSGTSIPKDTAAYECEISAVDFKDKTTWSNGNVSSYSIERPRGGFTHEQLLEREGERVTATWDGKLEAPPAIVLENVGTRPLTTKVVWVYQYDDKGKYVDRNVTNLSVDLEPGAKSTQKLGPNKLKPGTKYIEAVATDLLFRDGAREKWLNDNLAPLGGRPMKGSLK